MVNGGTPHTDSHSLSAKGKHLLLQDRSICARWPGVTRPVISIVLGCLFVFSPAISLFAQPGPAAGTTSPAANPTPASPVPATAPNPQVPPTPATPSVPGSDPASLPMSIFSSPPPPPSAPITGGVAGDGKLGITPEIPDYHLTQVRLDAQIAEDRVNLVATIELIINRGEGWHRVPLRLGSAHVTKREYFGNGGESPDVSPRVTDEGLVWLFRGIGRHQMKIHAWVPLKAAASGGQFQLSLPRLPPQFETRVRAVIPDPNAVVRSSKSLTVLETTRGEKETTVDASVIGNQLLFSWQTPSVAGETISLVQSWFHLKPAAEHLSLVVEQSFELQQTTASSVLVRLPEDFRLSQVSGQNFRSYELVPDRPNWVRVHFTNDNIGRLQLRWVLERDFDQQPQTLEIEGFQVEGAIREEGLIRIDEFENLRVIPQPTQSPLVHRVGVNLVRSLGSGVPLTAFEYLKQPFKLTFDIQPTAPYFLVEPQLKLRFEPNSTELTIRSSVRLERGAISELKLNWPDWLQQGWRIQSVTAEGDSVGPISYDATSQPGIVRLWWTNSLSQNATFTTVCTRTNSSDPVVENEFRNSLRLPVPLASELHPSILTIEAADQLSVDFTTADRQLLPTAPAVSPPKATTTTETFQGRLIGTYRLDDFSQPFAIKVQTHPREVSAVTEVTFREASRTRLSIEQKIELDVAYGRVRQLELVLPAELMVHIPDWAVPQGIDVLYQGKKLILQQGAVPNFIKVDLGEDRIGRFDIIVAYGFPIPEGEGTRDLDLPIIALNNVPFRRAECLIHTLETLQVRLGEPGWAALQTSPDQARWINSLKNGPLTSIPLSMGPNLADSSQQYVVNAIEVRTIFAEDGNAESWAEFRLDSPPNRIVIQFPAGTEFKGQGFLLDGVPFPNTSISLRSGTTEEITLTLPEEQTASATISVRYRTQLERSFGLTNRVKLPLPVFPKSVWVDETIWEVRLPEGQHLFTYPDLLPQLHWVRHLLFWYREPTPSYLAEREARNSSNIPPEFQFAESGFFAFRGFGPVQLVEFQVMNRSLILLLGAGLTLLLGFIFWRIPATRNVFSLIVISFVFAAASLWYVEPILLLIQPAILGVLLALTATVIDSNNRSRSSDHSFTKSTIHRPVDVSAGDSSQQSAVTRIFRPLSATKIRGQDSR